MRMFRRMSWLTILVPVLAFAGQEPEVRMGVRIAPTPDIDMESLVQLHEDIAGAPDGTIFSAEFMFDSPVKLGEIKRIASDLQILRATAMVEFGPAYRGNYRQRTFVQTGTLYNEPGSWDRETCRSRMIALKMPNAFPLDQPAEEWPVSELRVLGPAEALRFLLSGESLPSVVILEGRRQDPRYMDRFVDAIKRQHAEKIQVQDGDVIPEDCLPFTNRILAPILTGTPTIQPAEYGYNHNPEFLEIVRGHLAARSSNTPVTLQIILQAPATVEVFAGLAEQYRVDGMLAEMAPEDTSVRMISGVELSIHGGPYVEQVARFNCQLGLGNSQEYDGRWIARHAQISVPVDKAWNIVADERLIDARLLNEFDPGSLERIESYYQMRDSAGLALPESIAIPPGCEPYFHHAD